MSRPHPALFDLAAGRSLSAFEPEGLYVSSIDHRMSGLLASDLGAVNSLTDHDQIHLAGVQASMWAQNTMLRERLRDLCRIAADLDVEIGVYKGVVTEERWYDEVGQRVITDIDVIVSPKSLDRCVEFLEAVQVGTAEEVGPLLQSGDLQSCEVHLKGTAVDVHLDMLKLELLPSSHPEKLWAAMEEVEVSGTTVLTPDPSLSLVLTLLHIMRDRFRWLGAYADVARMTRSGQPDMAEVFRIARSEGLDAQVRFALDRINSDLNLGLGELNGTGPRYWVLGRLWPDVRSLRGTPDMHPPPRSTVKLALLVRGRRMAPILGWLRRLVPSRELLHHYYPNANGPYWLQLITTRMGKRIGNLRRSLRR